MRLLYSFAAALAVLALSTSAVCAQDIYYSLADFMPTWVNPALTGAYEGTARIGGLYRDQSRGFNTDAFQTPGVYVDAPILALGKKKKSWLGVGGTVISDTKGVAELSDTYLQASAAFHTILNERRSSRTVLSIGLRGGVVQRAADLSGESVVLEDEVELIRGGGGVGLNGSLDRMGTFSATGIDIGFGVSLARQIDAERNFRVGLSGQHLTTPDANLVDRQDGQRQVVFSAQAQYRQLLDNELLIEPAAYFWLDPSGAAAAQLQGMVGRYFGPDKDMLIKVGAGFRAPRQAYPMLGFEKGDLRVALAFDIYTGGQQGALQLVDGPDDGPPTGDTRTFSSAFEIGASYILKIYKQPKVEPVILCPQI